MKKRKRQKLDERKDAKRREWEIIKQLEKDERSFRLLDGHFDLDVFAERTEKGFVIHFDEAIKGLSCEGCVHLQDEDCRGKNLIGEMVMDCLKQDSHRYCEDGISEIGIEGLDDMDYDETVTE